MKCVCHTVNEQTKKCYKLKEKKNIFFVRLWRRENIELIYLHIIYIHSYTTPHLMASTSKYVCRILCSCSMLINRSRKKATECIKYIFMSPNILKMDRLWVSMKWQAFTSFGLNWNKFCFPIYVFQISVYFLHTLFISIWLIHFQNRKMQFFSFQA